MQKIVFEGTRFLRYDMRASNNPSMIRLRGEKKGREGQR